MVSFVSFAKVVFFFTVLRLRARRGKSEKSALVRKCYWPHYFL